MDSIENWTYAYDHNTTILWKSLKNKKMAHKLALKIQGYLELKCVQNGEDI